MCDQGLNGLFAEKTTSSVSLLYLGFMMDALPFTVPAFLCDFACGLAQMNYSLEWRCCISSFKWDCHFGAKAKGWTIPCFSLISLPLGPEPALMRVIPLEHLHPSQVSRRLQHLIKHCCVHSWVFFTHEEAREELTHQQSICSCPVGCWASANQPAAQPFLHQFPGPHSPSRNCSEFQSEACIRSRWPLVLFFLWTGVELLLTMPQTLKPVQLWSLQSLEDTQAWNNLFFNRFSQES